MSEASLPENGPLEKFEVFEGGYIENGLFVPKSIHPGEIILNPKKVKELKTYLSEIFQTHASFGNQAHIDCPPYEK